MLSLQKKLFLLLVAFLCGVSLVGSASANKFDKYYHETRKLNKDDSKYDNLENYVNKDEINNYLTSLNSNRKNGHIFILFEYTMTPDKSSWFDVDEARIQNSRRDDKQMFWWASESQKDIMLTLKKEHGKLHVEYFTGFDVPSTVNKKVLNKLVKNINDAPSTITSEEQTANLKTLIKQANFYQNESDYLSILKVTAEIVLGVTAVVGLFILIKKYHVIKKVLFYLQDEDVDTSTFLLPIVSLLIAINALIISHH